MQEFSTRVVVALAIASLALCGQSAVYSAAIEYSATLTGDQEVPPVATNATATATFVLSEDQSTLSYHIDIFGLDIGDIKTQGNTADDITGAHIHVGAPGTIGPVIFGIFRPQHDANGRFITINGPTGLVRFEGSWDAADVTNGSAPLADHLANLSSGGLYVNVHTTRNPGGEIRGQIIPEPSTVALAALALLALFLLGRSSLLESHSDHG